MVDFWRVETRDTNEGPYSMYGPSFNRAWKTDYRIEVPPGEDGLSVWAHDYRHIFGFQNVRQLSDWMSPAIIPALSEEVPGLFVIRHYEAPQYQQIGGHQVTANAEKLRELETFELSDLRMLCTTYDRNIIAVKEAYGQARKIPTITIPSYTQTIGGQ